jgi:hypothetical protein
LGTNCAAQRKRTSGGHSGAATPPPARKASVPSFLCPLSSSVPPLLCSLARACCPARRFARVAGQRKNRAGGRGGCCCPSVRPVRKGTRKGRNEKRKGENKRNGKGEGEAWWENDARVRSLRAGGLLEVGDSSSCGEEALTSTSSTDIVCICVRHSFIGQAAFQLIPAPSSLFFRCSLLQWRVPLLVLLAVFRSRAGTGLARRERTSARNDEGGQTRRRACRWDNSGQEHQRRRCRARQAAAEEVAAVRLPSLPRTRSSGKSCTKLCRSSCDQGYRRKRRSARKKAKWIAGIAPELCTQLEAHLFISSFVLLCF